MEENNHEIRRKKKGFNPLIAIIIAAVVLLVGGSVAAFTLLDKNPKEKYFTYEKNTIDMFTEQLEKRYEPETKWAETTLENPIEDKLSISAEVNIPLSDGSEPISPNQIINNSTITLISTMDRQEKIATGELQGSFGNFEVGDFKFYLTSEKAMLGLPFVSEILQLKGDDLGKLLQQVEPQTFTGEEKIDFNMLFEGNVLAEEDVKYIEEEYLKSLYDAIPEDAFETTDETVKIGSDNVDTEKVTFHLTEEQFKTILTDMLTKMAEDERLKELIVDYLQTQGTGPIVFGENSEFSIQNDFDEAYDTAIDDMLNGLDSFVMPEGLTSIIWVEDDVIVKRDFSFEIGPNKDTLAEVYIKGLHNNEKTKQSFEYDLGVVDQGVDQSISITGDLSFDDGKLQDTLTFAMDGAKLVYESNETLKDSKRDFERVFSLVEDETGFAFDLIWSGNAEYDGDQMKSEHELTFAGDDIMEDAVVLSLDKESKVIDGIELPAEDEIKDIGSMSMDEIMVYFESEVAPQFEEWLMGIIGFGL